MPKNKNCPWCYPSRKDKHKICVSCYKKMMSDDWRWNSTEEKFEKRSVAELAGKSLAY